MMVSETLPDVTGDVVSPRWGLTVVVVSGDIVPVRWGLAIPPPQPARM